MAGAEGLRLPRRAATRIVSEVAKYGEGHGVETGGFLLATADDPSTLTVVALAGLRGIDRSWGRFRISAMSIDLLFAWAESHELRIPAQFHSHDIGSRLSPIDRREGFNVRDFISSVVPSFRKPPSSPARWGWWMFDGRVWVETPAPKVASGVEVKAVVFDEDGVRPDA